MNEGLKLIFAPYELKFVDLDPSDTLILFLFKNKIPIKGLTGLVDWRLNGIISKWILENRIQGDFNERLLFPSFQRLPFQKILLLGIGEEKDFSEFRFQEIIHHMFEALEKLSIKNFSLSIPGEGLFENNFPRIYEILLREAHKKAHPDYIRIYEKNSRPFLKKMITNIRIKLGLNIDCDFV
jgi:hypothetical protein